MTRLEKVFEVKWQGFNLRRGAVFAVVLGLLIIVGVLPHDRRYFLSAIFGALLVALSDPGGKYGPRVLAMAAMAGAGALLTALGFGIGGGPWGFVVLAAFVATFAGRSRGEIRPAQIRRGLSTQHLVHHRPRPADSPLLRRFRTRSIPA